MSTPIEAVAAVGKSAASTAQQAPAEMAAAVTSQPVAEVGAGSGAADAFRSILDAFKSHTSGAEQQKGVSPATDPVAAAQADLLSAPTDAKSVTLSTKPEAAVGATSDADASMLQKSFDHAIFVSLVSQVVGGVSQATSTLVRQQ